MSVTIYTLSEIAGIKPQWVTNAEVTATTLPKGPLRPSPMTSESKGGSNDAPAPPPPTPGLGRPETGNPQTAKPTTNLKESAP